MFSAVHAPRTGTRSLFHCLHSILACIHKHITQRNVITMLVKLYGPFLWRSLKVRACACMIAMHKKLLTGIIMNV